MIRPGAAPGKAGRATPLIARTCRVMGTVVSFAVAPGDAPEAVVHDRLDAACAVLGQADATFSVWDPGSPVSRLRRNEIALSAAPPEVADVLQLCDKARILSRGWFDPWAMPGGVDPTGLVKGWAVERALDVLRLEGVTGALVNGGGDLAAFGCPAAGRAWRIGIRHPWRHDALACVIRIQAAVATSGTYERGPHLVDPFTGRPGNRAASATVTGPSLALADALATAVAAGGDDAMAAVAALDGYAGYLIRPDGSEADTGGIQFVS